MERIVVNDIVVSIAFAELSKNKMQVCTHICMADISLFYKWVTQLNKWIWCFLYAFFAKIKRKTMLKGSFGQGSINNIKNKLIISLQFFRITLYWIHLYGPFMISRWLTALASWIFREKMRSLNQKYIYFDSLWDKL